LSWKRLDRPRASIIKGPLTELVRQGKQRSECTTQAAGKCYGQGKGAGRDREGNERARDADHPL